MRVALGPAGAGQLVDISAGGIRVQSLAPLRRDAEVPVRLDIPERPEPLQLAGVVVWSKPNGAAGIRFTQMNDTQKEILQGWLSDLEKITLNPTKREDDEFTRIVSKVRAAKLNNADALNMIVSYVTEATSASGAAIALGTADTMVCMAAAGVAPEIGTSIPSGVGLTGECVRRRKMVHCQNAQNDPRVGRDLNLGSAVVLPLLVNGELRGILEAVSLSVYAFDPAAIDKLERLADAVVFLTFGVVPQRRIATVTPLTPATLTRLNVPSATLKSSSGQNTASRMSEISMRPGTTMPVVPSTSASPKPAPVVASFPLPSSAPKPQPSVATIPITPKAAPVAPKPITAEKVVLPDTSIVSVADPINITELDSVAKRIPLRYTETYEPVQESSPLRWIIAAVVVVVVVGGSVFAWRHNASGKQANPAAVVAADTTNSPAVQEIQNVAAPEAMPIAAVREQAPIPPSTPTTITKAASTKTSEPVTKEAHHDVSVEQPRPEPMMLSGGAPLRRAVEDDEDAPAAPQLTVPSTGPVPQLALPATASVPKLNAPVAKVRTGGNIIKQVPPSYPQIARQMHLEGLVELRVKVSKDGSVLSAERLSGPTVLANSAIDAVKRWRYEPFKLDGEPVEMDTIVKLNFNAPR